MILKTGSFRLGKSLRYLQREAWGESQSFNICRQSSAKMNCHPTDVERQWSSCFVGVLINILWIFLGIGHVRYINILTWLRGFRVKPLYMVLVSLYLSLFWELRDKGNLKNLQFWPESFGAMLEYWYIERGLLQKSVYNRSGNQIEYMYPYPFAKT